ncbi:MAG: FAD-dependent monooxygenase [Roseiarcus sp.]
MTRRALVVGAGIGGLAAALALARRGFGVDVFERAPALQEFGAGLQLTPNATRALERLGALAAAREVAMAPRAVRVLRGADGAELARLPVVAAERRWGAPYLAVHRVDLHRILAEAAAATGQVALHFGAEVACVASEAEAASVGLKRGAVSLRESGETIVGADGLRSLVRTRLGRGESDAPQFSYRVAFRATVEAEWVAPRWRDNEVTLRLGPRAHLVHYPLRGGSLINLVAVIESNWRSAAGSQTTGDDPWDGEADRETLDRAFRDWSHDARDLIAAPKRWRAWPLMLRPPLDRFAFGRIALIGDAAHPMTPFLAQGAAQAIEDADALARRLGETDDVEAALAAYSADRVARANRVQREASMQGRIYHLSGPFALARDLTMRALGPEGVLKRLDWLYAA